jgi:DNA gyrase subunit A
MAKKRVNTDIDKEFLEYSSSSIAPRNIEEEMKKAYLEYAMSVIVGRALPDVRDGLKPVHRRVLYAMKELALYHNKAFKKSATVVGDVLGKYHPHGDMSVYNTIVRMVQEFSLRYPLIKGQGNFGSIDGDNAAAYRYTEVKMMNITDELLKDIEKNTVDFVPNYDGSREEPSVLPALLPNLLINGSSGIAVGMATNIPPHNLTEVIDGIFCLMDNKDCTIADLAEFIKGPDFPTAGMICGKKGIKDAYETGRGSVKIRAKYEIEEIVTNKEQIVFTELPYQVNKANVLKAIAELVKDKKITGIVDLRDESNKDGIRMIVELKKDENAQVVINQLYKHTQLESSFGIIMLALVNNRPRVLNLKEVLENYLQHRIEVTTRRLQFELDKAEDRAHILEGLKIAIDNIDRMIEIIRGSADTDTAKNTLMTEFSLSVKQAQAILEMRLQQLTGLEREKLDEEYVELCAKIKALKEILGSEEKLLEVIKNELKELREKYGDVRRTEITADTVDIDIEDLIDEEDIVITLSNTGYIKRVLVETYRSQHRGGKGLTAMTTKEEDFVKDVIVTTTHAYILFFTNFGKVYWLKAYHIPDASRQSKGKAIINLINLQEGEKITEAIPIRAFTGNEILQKNKLENLELDANVLWNDLVKNNYIDESGVISDEFRNLQDAKEMILAEDFVAKKEEIFDILQEARSNEYLVMATKKGLIKKTPLSEYANPRKNGIIAITLNDGDELVDVKKTSGNHEIVIASKNGLAIHFNEQTIRSIGRTSKGVIGIRLRENDEVVGMDITHEDGIFLVATENGYGKRTKTTAYRLQNRGGKGVINIKTSDRNGKVVGVKTVNSEEEEIILITEQGMIIRQKVSGISVIGRNAQGVRLIKMNEGDKLVGLAKVDVLKDIAINGEEESEL